MDNYIESQASRVANILDIVGRATEGERLAGMVWYQSYGRAVSDYGVRHGVSAESARAIFAILSERAPIARNWGNFREVVAHRDVGALVGATGHMRRKVAGVLAGDTPLDLLVTGAKVSRFYRNLSGDYGVVAIDRHAIAVAEGQVPFDLRISTSSYLGYERAYQAAAHLLGIQPAQAQAIAWVVWRRLKGMDDNGAISLVA